MPVTDSWDDLTDEDWRQFAKDWMDELRHFELGGDAPISGHVVAMNFSARPEAQWTFIKHAVDLADIDDQLGHVAAGPIEHLIGWFGSEYLAIIEQEVDSNPKLLRCFHYICRYLMSDSDWVRVQALRDRGSALPRLSASR